MVSIWYIYLFLWNFVTKQWPVETYINCKKLCRIPKARKAGWERERACPADTARERERGPGKLSLALCWLISRWREPFSN